MFAFTIDPCVASYLSGSLTVGCLTCGLIIFPCAYTHVHRGNPPIGGVKYLATSWGWIQPDKSDVY